LADKNENGVGFEGLVIDRAIPDFADDKNENRVRS